MTRTHFQGPPYASLEGMCLVCVMTARGAELDHYEADFKRLEADGQNELQKWYEWDGTRELIREAVVEGVSDILPPAVGLVPLCWDHLAGITIPKRVTRLANGGNVQIPPGLRRGRG